MSLKRDDLGIPVLDAQDIEQLSERFLGHAAPQVLSAPLFTPLAEIMDLLRREGHCSFQFDEDLGATPEGYKYLGYFDIRRRHISIDRSLSTEDVRFPFTVAHELGHFYLHQTVRPDALGSSGTDAIRDSTRDLVTHRVEGSRPRSLIEWQANRFAAGILMPRRTVRRAVENAQRARGITRGLGTIWLDRQPRSKRDYHLVMGDISATYRVSRAVTRYRLTELGIIEVD